MKELIKKLSEMMINASPVPWVAKDKTNNGWSMYAQMPSFNHAEYTTRAGDRVVIEMAEQVMIGYQPWVQFWPKEYQDLMDANFKLMAEARNALPILLKRIEELEIENLFLRR